jgi:HD-GYP domain-containing protein (c-di-GMP phosphodiesterase class II)
MILRDSGRHFDPDITAVFSDLARTFQKVWRQLNAGVPDFPRQNHRR